MNYQDAQRSIRENFEFATADQKMTGKALLAQAERFGWRGPDSIEHDQHGRVSVKWFDPRKQGAVRTEVTISIQQNGMFFVTKRTNLFDIPAVKQADDIFREIDSFVHDNVAAD